PHVGHHPNGGRPNRHPLSDLRPKVGGLMSSMPRCTVVSFGYGHGPAPESDVIIDLRELLHRPLPTALRTMDGHDTCIKHWVENTPGAWAVINGVVDMVRGILAEAPHRNVQVAVGCTGGRHRAVVVAEKIGRGLEQSGYLVEVDHRDMHRALVAYSATSRVDERPARSVPKSGRATSPPLRELVRRFPACHAICVEGTFSPCVCSYSPPTPLPLRWSRGQAGTRPGGGCCTSPARSPGSARCGLLSTRFPQTRATQTRQSSTSGRTGDSRGSGSGGCAADTGAPGDRGDSRACGQRSVHRRRAEGDAGEGRRGSVPGWPGAVGCRISADPQLGGVGVRGRPVGPAVGTGRSCCGWRG